MRLQQSQQEVWNAIARQWSHFRQKPFTDIQHWLDLLLQKPRGKILEIGCGNCRNLLQFAKAGFECYGIDFSKEMLRQAREFCKKHGISIALKKANAVKLPFSNESFDYVLCIALLHHLKKREAVKAVKEAWKVLRPGGLAFFSVWRKNKEVLRKAKKVDKEGKAYLVPWCVEGVCHWRYYYFFSKAELKKILKQAGFEILGSSAEKNLCFLCQKK
jgi:ubiquinone/menaquinone biosynthesis C-methylase UbiE